MDHEVPGSVGTSASFSLRLGQAIFSSASLLFMSLGVEFYNYTAFWFGYEPVLRLLQAIFICYLLINLSSIFDAKAGIALNDNLVKLVSWYDNEWALGIHKASVLSMVNMYYK